ncbi:MAG: dynamin family protein [Firmicutes bacterium]|nr:dynamin family protein [Bacillota bacterium]
MNKLNDYFNRVDSLANRYLAVGELPTVALAGPYNSGKSTMINSLLEQDISPVDILPATSLPVIFSYGELFSVTARLTDGRVKALSSAAFRSLPQSKATFAKQASTVEIALNHTLLRKMRLLDTPGFDAADAAGAADADVPSAQLAAADHIIYLLHQRGPGEADRKFIGRLMALKGVAQLSFWINRNLGCFDGTSLTESRRVLREVCAREVPVYVTDTRDREAVQRFRLFIRARAAETVINLVSGKLDELDRRIPTLTAASLRESNDIPFLLRFWEAGQTAAEVIQGNTIIHTLPLVAKQINDAAANFSDREETSPAGANLYRTKTKLPDPVALRDSMKSLLNRAANDPSLQSAKETIALLRTLVRELTAEKYLVTAAGGFSTGKTTFFNALLGESLLPAKNRPTTFTLTRLRHGDHKKAVIKFASRVAIATHWVENKQAVLCRHELEVLESWLTDPKLRGKIKQLEKTKNGVCSVISPKELLAELEKLKETFARVKRRSPKGRKPWQSLFKRIPLASLYRGGLADSYVVYFPHLHNIELDLTSPAGLLELEQTVSSHQALRVEEIEISHPAEILRSADFLDTPGLDSVYHRHREITTRHLADADCFLFFMNGKHILTKPDLGVYNLIFETLSASAAARDKLYIIVNFADTLSEGEKERVRNYLDTNLTDCRDRPNQSKIYLFSALEALTGKDKQLLNRLTADLQAHIWASRCTDQYLEVLRRAKSALAGLAEETTSVLPPSSQPNGHLQQDLAVVTRAKGTLTLRTPKDHTGLPPAKVAAQYARALENLEKEMLAQGGKTNGKRQGAR